MFYVQYSGLQYVICNSMNRFLRFPYKLFFAIYILPKAFRWEMEH